MIYIVEGNGRVDEESKFTPLNKIILRDYPQNSTI